MKNPPKIHPEFFDGTIVSVGDRNEETYPVDKSRTLKTVKLFSGTVLNDRPPTHARLVTAPTLPAGSIRIMLRCTPLIHNNNQRFNIMHIAQL